MPFCFVHISCFLFRLNGARSRRLLVHFFGFLQHRSKLRGDLLLQLMIPRRGYGEIGGCIIRPSMALMEIPWDFTIVPPYPLLKSYNWRCSLLPQVASTLGRWSDGGGGVMGYKTSFMLWRCEGFLKVGWLMCGGGVSPVTFTVTYPSSNGVFQKLQEGGSCQQICLDLGPTFVFQAHLGIVGCGLKSCLVVVNNLLALDLGNIINKSASNDVLGLKQFIGFKSYGCVPIRFLPIKWDSGLSRSVRYPDRIH